MSGRPSHTISLSRLGAIATFAGGGFAAGFLVMSMVNAVAYGLAGAAGAHPTGAGNAASQLAAGVIVAVIAASITALVTAKGDADERGTRIETRIVAAGLAFAIAVPLVTRGLLQRRAESVEMHGLETAVRTRGLAAFDDADSLWRFSRGPRALSAIVHDRTASPEARLTAGLMLIETDEGTAEDRAEVERLIGRGSSQRRTFVELYATERHIYSDVTIERWIREALQDPEPAIRVAALRALMGQPKDMGLCAPLDQLAHDPDATIRAQAMLLVSACPADPRLILRPGSGDTDPRVRLAVVKRLGWRFDGTSDSPFYLTVAEELLTGLLEDSDLAVRQAAASQLDAIRARSRLR